MNGVYLKLAIYLHGLQCDKFIVLAVCVPSFRLLKQLLGFLIMIILLFLLLLSSSAAAALTLNNPVNFTQMNPLVNLLKTKRNLLFIRN